jgi:DHA2 family multidrug resistance protein
MLYFGAVVLLPLMLQTQMGYTATWAGSLPRPSVFCRYSCRPSSARMHTGWTCAGWSPSASACMPPASSGAAFNPEMDFAYVVWPQFIQGIGVACFFMPLTTITLSGLRPNQIASASSLSNFLRILAGGIGYLHHHHAVGPTRSPAPRPAHPACDAVYDQASLLWFRLLESTGMSSSQQQAYTALQITRQGSLIGVNEVFWLFGIMFVALIALVWFARPPFTSSGAADSGAH